MLISSNALQVVTVKKLISADTNYKVLPFCKIEDETHLLLDCKRYSSIRDVQQSKIDDIRKLLSENLISQLMNSNDYYINLQLIVFISSCFEMRGKIDLTLHGILDKC